MMRYETGWLDKMMSQIREERERGVLVDSEQSEQKARENPGKREESMSRSEM